MSTSESIMLGFVLGAGMLIVWLLLIEAFEAIRKKRLKADTYEQSLTEMAEGIVRKAEEAREADRRSRQRVRERWAP